MSYASDFSKSQNALQAEGNGRFPASVLAKRLGVKMGAIRAILSRSEWHHTSKHYNVTSYYSEDEALEALAELKAWKEPAKETEVIEDCTGSFLLWGGTRNHPKATVVNFGPIQVVRKGDFFILELPNRTVRKRRSTRGFKLFTSGKQIVLNP